MLSDFTVQHTLSGKRPLEVGRIALMIVSTKLYRLQLVNAVPETWHLSFQTTLTAYKSEMSFCVGRLQCERSRI